MIRITTNGSLRNYKSSLMRSSNMLDYSRNKVLSKRNFSSFAEDPAAATQAFKLRRAFSRTSDQLGNVKSLSSKFQSAWDAMSTVKSDLIEKEGKVSALAGISDDTAAGRQPLAEVLKSAAESIVQTMNTQYGSSFVFGGSDSLNGAPFELITKNDGSYTLTYRGIDVNTNDPDELAKLKAMSQETSFVDIGSGLTEINGKLVESSAFNGALSGVDYLGFGKDADGDPKNAAAIMLEISSIFSRCDADSGTYQHPKDKEDAIRLTGKLQSAMNEVTNKWTQLDAESSYLTNSKELLTGMANTLNEQILDLEQVDLASAITDFSWAQYCYNAALKVGNSILSQSLIDYMN